MTSASSTSDPAQASLSRSWKYDVFLSFRGEDTRKAFVDHLYSALVERLIRVYKDDEALPRGDSIGQSLLKAIEESHIAVIVFSKNYADSSWCLNELAHIIKCRDERGLTVMPIFYDVDPSQVRKQDGNFGEAFAKQEAKNFMNADLWRKVLIKASNIAGWEPSHIANGYESKVIKEIVDKIQDRLFPLDSNVDEELVGMRVRLQDLISRLEIGSGGVRMVGIWGIGGSGKTTLAFSVYTQISRHFQGHCFIANIREQSKHGLEKLQQKFLSTVLKKKVKVESVEEGKSIIKSRLCNSKVLVLLDDVDDLDQLQALAGSHKWFGVGSRIIITTRDEHVLTTHGVDHISPAKLLSDEEAILLLYKHAYNEKKPLKDYETLSLRVFAYAAGLPLALKVLGSFLFDKDENEWISTMAMLKDFPNIKIMDILRISYDGLETLQKELFLDIACFFRGKSTNITEEAMMILDACGFHPVIGIKVLQERALISIVDGKFDMHDLVQEMGRYIVRGEHPNNPEKHSRVWKEAEIDNMHLGDATKGNQNIEALDYSGHHLSCFKIISKMKKIRWLSVDLYLGNSRFKHTEGPSFLSNELRYFKSIFYPASPFPDSFQLLKLVVLKMVGSMQKELWNGYKHLPNLKVLELIQMGNLLSTPDFTGLPCLQKLKLDCCRDLEEIHPSLGNHRSLEYVCVFGCRKLRIFPTIVRMQKLNTLEISYCNNLIELPDIQANMERLEKLTLLGSNFEFLHYLIGERHTQVETVFYRLTHIVQKLNFRSLRKLNLGGWGFKDQAIPSDICELSNDFEDYGDDDAEDYVNEVPNFLSNELRYFNSIYYPASPFPDSFQPLKLCVLKMNESLQKELWNGYKHLPHLKVLELSLMPKLLRTLDFDGLPCLQKLKLIFCDELEEIHPSLGNHRSLEKVSVLYCYKLRIFPTIVRMEKLNTLEISYCNNLIELPDIQDNMERLEKLTLLGSNFEFLHYLIGERHTQVETVFYRLTHIVQKLNFRSLRKLNLGGWGFKDQAIPSDICELSNLEELDLSGNDFSRLYLSLSRLTQLRHLCLDWCKKLVELPELPSSLAFLKANYCDSLTSIGNSHRNCKRLYEVSLVGGGIITDGNRLLQSMLQGSDIENYCMTLRLEGLQIPKRFLPYLVSGKTCRLQLPENWCNDFSGFIIYAACTSDLLSCDRVEIRMEQVMSGGLSMDSQYEDEAWKESADDGRTWVGFVSFDRLKHTSWWDETYNALWFSVEEFDNICSGFGIGLVPKRTGISSAETSTCSPAFSNYYSSRDYSISHDSASALWICF